MTIRFRAKKRTSFPGSKTLTAITDNHKFFIGIPVVRTDGRSFVRSVYGHVIIKFSGMGRFTYPWCSASARFARGSSAINGFFFTSRYVNSSKKQWKLHWVSVKYYLFRILQILTLLLLICHPAILSLHVPFELFRYCFELAGSHAKTAKLPC